MAADRCGDARIAEGDKAALQGSLGRVDVSPGLRQRGLRVLVVLAAHRIDLDQFGRTARIQLGLLQGGPGTAQGRPGTGDIGLVDRVRQLVQGLSRLDHLALDKQALRHDTAHLRAHLGDQGGRDAARQLTRQRDLLRFQCDDGHGRCGLCRRRRVGLAASGQEE